MGESQPLHRACRASVLRGAANSSDQFFCAQLREVACSRACCLGQFELGCNSICCCLELAAAGCECHTGPGTQLATRFSCSRRASIQARLTRTMGRNALGDQRRSRRSSDAVAARRRGAGHTLRPRRRRRQAPLGDACVLQHNARILHWFRACKSPRGLAVSTGRFRGRAPSTPRAPRPLQRHHQCRWDLTSAAACYSPCLCCSRPVALLRQGRRWRPGTIARRFLGT